MLKRQELLKQIIQKNDTKMVLLVLDGLGGLPGENGKTELEAANTPNMDDLATKSETGLLTMVDVGITPGSGPGHLALFGYDPLEHQIGRGILEALGVGAHVEKDEVAVRANFATWAENDIVIDRRAGRIPTEESRKLVEKLGEYITEIDGVKIKLYPGKEHRFVVIFSGPDLSDAVEDADPQKNGLPMKWAKPKNDTPQAKKTAEIANKFIKKVREIVKYEPKANGCLLRGFAMPPDIPSLSELYGIKCAALAIYPMYKGLAKLVGMDLIEVGQTHKELFEKLKEVWNDYDFFFVHIKYTDSRGEDGDYEAKLKVIEEIDGYIPEILSLKPDVLVITGDHSTPSQMKTHSWHPVPMLLHSKYVRPDGAIAFGERECARGILGNLEAKKLLGLMLAHAQRLTKYGA